MRRRRTADPARRVAFRVLRRVTSEGAYANLALAAEAAGLNPRDAAFATELTFGTCRALGTYDAIIEAAASRPVGRFETAVLDVLRLGTHQLLAMRVPAHAAVATSVDLAACEVGERVTGLVNAVLRKVGSYELDGWIERLSADRDATDAVALATHHPRWIVETWRAALVASSVAGPNATNTGDASASLMEAAGETVRPLPDAESRVATGASAAISMVGAADGILGASEDAELRAALDADNVAPVNHLVVRPGLAEVSELGGTPARFSPYGAYAPGAPGSIPAVAEGRAGVQDEGSQLVAMALSRVEAPDGPWLDLCAGPGGKAALLAGLALQRGARLVANELQPHRAALVAQNLAVYSRASGSAAWTAQSPAVSGDRSRPVVPDAHGLSDSGDDLRPVTLVADGTRPAWRTGSFARVMADVPCTGLGALRRRPESRWRRQPSDLPGLVGLQRRLLKSAIASAMPGGVVAYVTCSPHLSETREVVATATGVDLLHAADYLPEVPGAAAGDFVQLWPHRHGTDAMFLALLRRNAA